MRFQMTMGMLEAKVTRLNYITGVATDAIESAPLWQKTTTPDGKEKLVANVGMFYIEKGYGGYSLLRMVTPTGGASDVFMCGHVSKRELGQMIDAYIAGHRAGEAYALVGTVDQHGRLR